MNQRLNIEGNALIFLKNTAPAGAAMPAYQVFKGTNAPFKANDSYSHFTFADIDGDGIKEGIQFENSPNSFKILKNTTGSANNIQFATIAATSVGLPVYFNTLTFDGNRKVPLFSDLDNDGISDISSFANIQKYFKNTGTASTASFVELNTTDAPFSFSPKSNVGNSVFPAFADLDGDGTDEIIYGNNRNEVIIGKNTSAGTNLSFATIPSSNNPFSIPTTQIYFAFFSPTDIDNDGDIDILAFGGDIFKKQFYLFENKLNSNRPTLSNISLSATAGQILNIPVTAIGANFADVDGQTLQKLRITTLPTKGTLSISGVAAVANQEYIVAGISSIVYLPNTGYQGADMFGWNGSDGVAYAASGTTTAINVITVNSAPTLSNISLNATFGQLLSIPVTAIGANFADVDGQTLQKLRITSLPTNGALSISGVAAVANQEYTVAGISSIVYLPNTGYQGSDMFGWNGSDGFLYAATGASTTINVITVNSAPTLTNISLSATAGQLLSIPVTAIGANFADVDGQTLQKLRITSLPTNGALSISGVAAVANQEYIVAGVSSIVYLPNTGYQGADMFGWNGSDGFLYAASGATTTINIVTVAGVSTIPGTTTGLSQGLQNDVSVYPVPSYKTLFVKLGNSKGLVTSKVYDITGIELFETNTYSLASDFVLELPIETLPQGTYILKIITSDSIVTKKFIKN